MSQEVTQLLGALTALVNDAHLDKVMAQRRVRFAKMAREYKRLVRAIQVAHRVESKPRPNERQIHAELLAKGWVDISRDRAMQTVLATLESKSALRVWYVGPYQSTTSYLAAAPKWAVVVARYAPDKLREAFASREQKRKALIFQLEAQAQANAKRGS
jgi:hypothetical protein